ncbi:hypothetical protein [Bradyrhizobium sp.]|jgi:hypothetical protein|uniref:hypothetical protein n=1 Tax=Bradyrhizobium sp. TaxID=376 RepID=UPI002BF6D75F|nr:hypothetical protein [Bradyrhizobium sp.]HWX62754.1 hypothetical protein [Bradyrhizobium sp.]
MGIEVMRSSSVFFAVVHAFLPALAHAGDDCSPNNRLSEIAARKHTALIGPLAVAELENKHMVVIRETGMALPFGDQNRNWQEMKAAMKPGDQIYQVVFQDGIFHADYHILARNGCAIRSLAGSIT